MYQKLPFFWQERFLNDGARSLTWAKSSEIGHFLCIILVVYLVGNGIFFHPVVRSSFIFLQIGFWERS